MIRAGTMVGTVALIAWAGQLAAAEMSAASGQGRADTVVFPAQVAQRQSLDLRAPDITKLYTPEQIARIIGPTSDLNIEEVEVQGARGRRELMPLEGWSGAGAPLWALLRLIGPTPPDRVATQPPDTLGFLEPAAAHATASLTAN